MKRRTRIGSLLLALAVLAPSLASASGALITGRASRTGSRPTCSTTCDNEGTMWIEYGAPSTVEICSATTSAGACAWRAVTVGTATLGN